MADTWRCLCKITVEREMRTPSRVLSIRQLYLKIVYAIVDGKLRAAENDEWVVRNELFGSRGGRLLSLGNEVKYEPAQKHLWACAQ